MYLFSLYLSIVQPHINQLKVLFDENEFDLMCMNVLYKLKDLNYQRVRYRLNENKKVS